MHYAYLLQGEKNNCIYVGNTNDLKKRLIEHNQGKVYATKRYAPFMRVYYEAYLDKTDVLDREDKLKHHSSVIGHLKRRLKHSLSKSITAQKGGV